MLSNSNMSVFSCHFCKNEYGCSRTLARHLRFKHDYYVSKNASYICDVCGEFFFTKKSIAVHLKSHVSNESNKRPRSSRLLCPECQTPLQTYARLHTHIAEEHHIHLEKRVLTFANVKEFNEWKESIERSQHVLYVSDSGAVKKNGNIRKYYACHRSYSARLIPERKRRLKSTGSSKMNAVCPSNICMIRTQNEVTVKYCSTHLGHTCDIEYLTLQKSDREQIAEQLASGETVQRILENVRNQYLASSNQLQRLHLIKKRDIYNIKRDFGIGNVQASPEPAVLSPSTPSTANLRTSDNSELSRNTVTTVSDNLKVKLNRLKELFAKENYTEDAYREMTTFMDSALAIAENRKNVVEKNCSWTTTEETHYLPRSFSDLNEMEKPLMMVDSEYGEMSHNLSIDECTVEIELYTHVNNYSSASDC